MEHIRHYLLYILFSRIKLVINNVNNKDFLLLNIFFVLTTPILFVYLLYYTQINMHFYLNMWIRRSIKMFSAFWIVRASVAVPIQDEMRLRSRRRTTAKKAAGRQKCAILSMMVWSVQCMFVVARVFKVKFEFFGIRFFCCVHKSM